jgi:hypothetical protein
MSYLEYKKVNIVRELRGLCAHCVNGKSHSCPIQRIVGEVSAISGIPVMVDDKFRGVVMVKS